MKKILYITLAIALFGCKDEVTSNYAIISGKITNKQAGDLTINSEDGSFKQTLPINADGTFRDTLSTDIKSYILFDGINPVFLNMKPGFNLNITYDAQNFDNTIQVSGTGSEINNYLITKTKNEKVLRNRSAEIFVQTEADFKKSMLNFKKSQEEVLKITKGLPSDFITKEKRNLNYSYLNKLNTYERGHRYFTKNEGFNVSEGFLKDIENLDYTNAEDFNFSNDYKAMVSDHYTNIAKNLSKNDSITNGMAFLKTVSAIENENIKNTLLFDYANFNMPYVDDVDAFYNTFLKESTNKKNNAIVTKTYNNLMALSKGKASPKFVNYKNHAGGEMSLEDLKGKYVYVDVWATWCGPCIQQIPFLKKVEEKYRDKNIAFVSISIDKITDYEKWIAMVNEKELRGIQLFADNDWNSTFVQEYQIKGIPKFILIDTEGNILDANAPRPSSEKLIELFNEHNI